MLLSAPLVWVLASPSGANDAEASAQKLARGDAVAQAEKTTQTAKRVDVRKTRPVYKPPARGTPQKKVGGGARSPGGCSTPLTLAPEHLAQTVSASPVLFWYTDAASPSSCKVMLTVQDEDGVKPLAELDLPSPIAAGIQRIDLGEHGVVLQAEVEYEWLISIVPDSGKRSADLISNAYILRIAPPAELSDRSAWGYAEHGIWYDALEAISDDVDAYPRDLELREARNALLFQVGLGSAADPLPGEPGN